MRSELIDANGIRFHCLTDGAGPLVILLHGFPQFSYEYRHLVPALARAGYRAVAPDMRGFGETSRPGRIEDYALQTLGDDIAALIDALGGPKAHVLGHEWGGIVAAETALSHPDKVDHLILVNGTPAITLGRAIHHSWRQRARSSYVLFYRIPHLPEWWLTALHGRALSLLLSDRAFTAEDLAVYRDAICRPRAAWAGMAYFRSIAHTIKDDADRLRGKRIASRYTARSSAVNARSESSRLKARPDEVARLVIGFIDEDRRVAS